MKQARTAFIAAIALLAAAAPAAPAAPCRVPAAQTVAANKVAKLLSVPTPFGRALYACIRRSGHTIALDEGFSDLRLAGRWVAWQRPERRGQWRIAVHDLRSGRERLVNGRVAAHSLGLTTRGSVVWAQIGTTSATPLFANELLRGRRVLDPGDVDARSVTLTGRRVRWLSGGAKRSAQVR